MPTPMPDIQPRNAPPVSPAPPHPAQARLILKNPVAPPRPRYRPAKTPAPNRRFCSACPRPGHAGATG